MTIVSAFASSHAALMVTRKERCDPQVQQNVYAAFQMMGERLAEAEVDVVVVIGTDHGRHFTLAHVPAFTIGVGTKAVSLGDGGLPVVEYPVDGDLAAGMLDAAIDAQIDLAFSEEARIDHSFVTPLLLAFGERRPTIVPVTQNCGIPPQPLLRRSYAVGQALGAAAEASERRVAVIGTGGLSHWVGSDERRAFMRRTPGTRYAEMADHPVEVGATGPVNEEFDRQFLALAHDGRWDEVFAWSSEWIEREAGNGAQEIRNWVAAAGFAGGAPLASSSYAAVPEWLTGTAVAEFDLTRRQAPAIV
jgi:aromatic ring-opening dioxygenase catalytic subunit (LigB family)